MPVLSVTDPYTVGRHGILNGLDIRIKLLIALACSVLSITFGSSSALVLLLAASVIYVALLRRFGVVVIAYCFIMILMATAIACAKMMTIWVPDMARFDITMFIFPFLRLLVMINNVLVIALSSDLQTLLASLKSLRLPYFIYLPAAVMLRFVPSFINDAKQISDSLKTKGYPLTPMGVISRPFFTLRILFVPLVIRALRTSEELGVAAELKGAGSGVNLTVHRARRLASSDWVALAVAILWFLFAAIVEYGGR